MLIAQVFSLNQRASQAHVHKGTGDGNNNGNHGQESKVLRREEAGKNDGNDKTYQLTGYFAGKIPEKGGGAFLFKRGQGEFRFEI